MKLRRPKQSGTDVETVIEEVKKAAEPQLSRLERMRAEHDALQQRIEAQYRREWEMIQRGV